MSVGALAATSLVCIVIAFGVLLPIAVCKAAQDQKWEKASWEAERELRLEALSARRIAREEFDVRPLANTGVSEELEVFLAGVKR